MQKNITTNPTHSNKDSEGGQSFASPTLKDRKHSPSKHHQNYTYQLLTNEIDVAQNLQKSL